MKKIFVVIMLLLLARIPIVEWDTLTEERKIIVAETVGQVYLSNIDKGCKAVRVSVFDGGDGFVYFDAECSKRKGTEI
jgi:hypothetical protein